jgi:hypothetical protein
MSFRVKAGTVFEPPQLENKKRLGGAFAGAALGAIGQGENAFYADVSRGYEALTLTDPCGEMPSRALLRTHLLNHCLSFFDRHENACFCFS